MGDAVVPAVGAVQNNQISKCRAHRKIPVVLVNIVQRLGGLWRIVFNVVQRGCTVLFLGM